MLPLKTLPKILKHASPNGIANSPNGNGNGSGRGALASIKYNDIDSASQISVASSSAVSAMEAEEKELKERLIVLEEQRFLVGEMMEGARRGRKFDEVAALSASRGELEREIDSVNGLLSGLDFRGVYENGALGLGR